MFIKSLSSVCEALGSIPHTTPAIPDTQEVEAVRATLSKTLSQNKLKWGKGWPSGEYLPTMFPALGFILSTI